MLDSLVRVSRRAGLNHFVKIPSAQASPAPRRGAHWFLSLSDFFSAKDHFVTDNTMDDNAMNEMAERAAKASILAQRESFQHMLDETLPGALAGFTEHQAQQYLLKNRRTQQIYQNR